MDLIDRGELRMIIYSTERCNGKTALIEAFNTIINNASPVDAEPVRHGKWDYVTVVNSGFWRCSNCGASSEVVGVKYLYRYCPYCGAKMDADEEKQNETI